VYHLDVFDKPNGEFMSVISSAAKTARAARAPSIGAKYAVHDPRQFWAIEFKRQTANPQARLPRAG
jgi:hypothetical protein